MTLGSEWQLRGFLGDEWRWHLEKPWDAPGWIRARVPGSVLDDLWRAGEVPDPYHGRNSRLVEWVPERAWVYRRPVEGPGVVRFDGVDHAATVFVDGGEVAAHEGAFTPFEVELGEGEHALAVVVHPAPASEPQVGRTSRVRVHKSRMGYGWDFCPRMINQGIWRPVTLNPAPPVRPIVCLEDGLGTVELDGEVVLRVDEPRLWWPNGMGEQHLYEVERRQRRLPDGRAHARLRARRQRRPRADQGLELVPARPAVRRAAAREAAARYSSWPRRRARTSSACGAVG